MDAAEALDRTAAAVIFDWDGTAVPDRRASAALVRRRVERLCAIGVHVAVVSGTHVENLDGQLGARPAGPGRLLLASNRGSELYEVRPQGPALLRRRVATTDEVAALDAAAQRVSRALTERGLGGVVVTRLNRRKIDLLPEPAWADPPKARIAELVAEVTRRLEAAGFTGLEDVVSLARRAAADAGLADPRVTSDAKHVEIGLTDKSDSMRELLGLLADVGVGAGLVLVAGDEFGPLGGAQGSDSFLLVPEARRATVVSVGVEPSGVPDGVRLLGGGPARFVQLLDEQLLRHRRRRVPCVDRDPAWTVTEDGTDPLRHRITETLFTLGAGGVATRGSLEESPSVPLLLAAGVYHRLGPAQHLLPGPLWTQVTITPAPAEDVRVLDLRSGVLAREEVSATGAPLRSLRFCSVARPGLLAMRVEADERRLRPGAAFRAPPGLVMAHGRLAAGPWARVASDLGGGIAALARQVVSRGGPLRSVERLVAVTTDPRRQPSLAAARETLDAAAAQGFDALLAEHRAAWAERWSAVDVRIPDDPDAERAIRYALFQLWCNTTPGDELAVGARGLSGPGYSGHVFWDADVFVLPALVSMDPLAAHAMVRYRLHRLGAARARARAAGHAGARFPWESAQSGDDVTPPTVHLGAETTPVLTGSQEEHITADVAWAVLHCARWTGRRVRAGSTELELLLETARYWADRCRTAPDGTSHLDGVVGPDEYHDSVDDNAFTNVMARWNLRSAAAAAAECGAASSQAASWLALADSLVDGLDPGTGVYEQFRGYHALEPLLVTDLAPPPVAADVLFGRERIAASQVIKQPDVLMLHHLVPEEVAEGSLAANLDHYLPRTAHGSSLSPAITASLLARAGRPDEALSMLRTALGIDLGDVLGMTAAGLHLATLGGVWQAVLHGFLGASVHDGALQLDPVLPTRWRTLEVRFRCLGRRVRVRVDGGGVDVAADGALAVGVGGAPPQPVSGSARFERPAARAEGVRGRG